MIALYDGTWHSNISLCWPYFEEKKKKLKIYQSMTKPW